jgi:predicted nucleic acid-binding protein
VNISYLVDTDWVVHHMNGVEEIRQRLKEMQPHGLGLSVISLAELYEGVCYSRDPQRSQQRLDAFLTSVTVLGVDEEICKIFGKHRGLLRQRGMIIGDFDLLIAATCLCHELTLLTNNLRHFQRVGGLVIISAESLD